MNYLKMSLLAFGIVSLSYDAFAEEVMIPCPNQAQFIWVHKN